ncbi:cation:proton antiporter, partial [Candidatus Bathyarchaeota archaeon]|nr:cation:proton antiporter [Candidatus Bathyarchaeota archaeon]
AFGVAVILGLILVTLGKFLGGVMVGRVLTRNRHDSALNPWSFGAWLVPRGEFSFVIGQFALATGLITTSVFSFVGLSVLVTALAGPFLQRLAGPRLAENSHLLKPHTDG